MMDAPIGGLWAPAVWSQPAPHVELLCREEKGQPRITQHISKSRKCPPLSKVIITQ
jgi:hypothetical protein